MQDLRLLAPGEQFYVPLYQTADTGDLLFPTAGLPAGWSSAADGFWHRFSPSTPLGATEGWKVHVAATPPRLQTVLDVVAEACTQAQVPFKCLGSSQYFLLFHHKHASRVQSGKFCTAYPRDADAARALMERLVHELADEVGPYVLTDRRYRDGKVVSYRYGAFVDRPETLSDGSVRHLVRDGSGRDVEDRRDPYFSLPEGITDPFAPAPEPRAPSGAGRGRTVLDRRFEVLGVVRHSNSGGTYRARDLESGDTVFIKEARPHNGYTSDGMDAAARLRREYDTLVEIDGRAPGLGPKPIAFFTKWEHSYLVCEWIPGVSLLQWVAAHTPLAELNTTAQERAAYFDRASAVARALRAAFDRLHALELRFGDVSHGNVLIDQTDRVRLIDFETATPYAAEPVDAGTIGYLAPAALGADADQDEYGFAALVMALLFPLGRPLEADPAGRLALHRRDLETAGPVPAELWSLATRYYGRLGTGTAPGLGEPLPTAAELDDRPLPALEHLGDRLADGLLRMAEPGRADWLFPPSPAGYTTNTHCLAHGTAGVLHALRHWRAGIPDVFEKRFRQDALNHAPGLSAGLQTGCAGLAWVLTEFGHCDEAAAVLDLADGKATADGLLGTGRLGVALARLALFRATGDERHLRAAAAEGDRVAGRDGTRSVCERAGTPGLEAGISGAAVFLHALWRVTAEDAYLPPAVRLMHAELDRAKDAGARGLRFHDGGGGTRVITYLAIGGAGVATALTKIAQASGDEHLVRALPRVLRACQATSSVEPGLYTGVASWAFAFAEHADHCDPADRTASRDTAIRIATSLTKYVVRTPAGLRVLGAFEPRYHADLATGSAGVLLALGRVLRGSGAEFLSGGMSVASEAFGSPASSG